MTSTKGSLTFLQHEHEVNNRDAAKLTLSPIALELKLLQNDIEHAKQVILESSSPTKVPSGNTHSNENLVLLSKLDSLSQALQKLTCNSIFHDEINTVYSSTLIESIKDLRLILQDLSPLIFHHSDHCGTSSPHSTSHGGRHVSSRDTYPTYMGREIGTELLHNISNLVGLLVEQVIDIGKSLSDAESSIPAESTRQQIFRTSTEASNHPRLSPHQALGNFQFSILALKGGASLLQSIDQEHKINEAHQFLGGDKATQPVGNRSSATLGRASNAADKLNMLSPHVRRRHLESTNGSHSSFIHEQQDQLLEWSSNVDWFVNKQRRQKLFIVLDDDTEESVAARGDGVLSIKKAAAMNNAPAVLSEISKVQSSQDDDDSQQSSQYQLLRPQAKELPTTLAHHSWLAKISTKWQRHMFEAAGFIFIPWLIQLTLRYLRFTQLEALLVALCMTIGLFLTPAVRERSFLSEKSRPLLAIFYYSQLPQNCLPRQSLVLKIVDSILDRNPVNMRRFVIIHGHAGSGKSTLAALVVRNRRIHSRFNGMAWINMGKEQISYHRLTDLYRIMFDQLLGNSKSPLDQFYFIPDVGVTEQMAMDGLKQEVQNLLLSKKANYLIVLDNVCVPSDTKWFCFDKSREAAGQCSLLITSEVLNSVQDVLTNTAVGIKAEPLTKGEAFDLFYQYCDSSFLTSELSRNVVTTFSNVPLVLKLIGKIMMEEQTYAESNSVSHQRIQTRGVKWDGIERNLSPLNPAPPQEMISRVFNSGLSCICHEASDVIELCLNAFSSVFMYDSSEGSFPLLEPYIPSRVANLLWEEMMESAEVTNEHILSIENAISRCAKTPSNFRLFTRSGFVREKLVALGAIQISPDGRGLALLATANWVSRKSSPFLHEASLRNRWSECLVRGYEKSAKLCLLDAAERRYFVRWLPLHVFRAGMSEKATSLLKDRNFIRQRFEELRPEMATRQHIVDFEAILHKSSETGARNFTGTSIMKTKSSMMMAFENISELLQGLCLRNSNSEQLRSYDASPIEIGACVLLLASALRKSYLRNESVAFYLEAIQILSSSLTDDCQDYRLIQKLLSRGNVGIGSVFQEREEYEEALKYFAEGLRLAKSAGGADHDVAQILCSIGVVCSESRKFDDAIVSLSEAIALRKGLYGMYHPYVAHNLHELAVVYFKSNHLEDALRVLSLTLCVQKSVFGTDNNETVARTLKMIGDTHTKLSNTDLAIQTYTKALIIQKRVLGKDNVDYGLTLHKLGDALVAYSKALTAQRGNSPDQDAQRVRGSLDDALVAYNKALAVHKGKNPELYAQTLHSIGLLHCQLGNLDPSMEAYMEALQIRKQLFGSRHQDFARTLHSIGVVHKLMGDMDRAYEAFSEALWASAAERNFETPASCDIIQRVTALFGERAEKLPLFSCRIFACASLIVDQMIYKERSDGNENGKAALHEWVNSILPLLKSYVNAERVALGDGCGYSGGSIGAEKKVTFSAFDFSSVSPPVDMIKASNSHLERSIEALEVVVKEINMMVDKERTQNARKNKLVRNAEIAKMLLVFNVMASPNGEPIRIALAEAMPTAKEKSWLPSRFAKAADLYKHEFETIIAQAESATDEQNYFSSNTRQSLGSQIHSNIRYHMRRLFDFPPMGFTVPSEDQPIRENFSECRARTHEIVAMCSPDNAVSLDRPMLWETSISYVFNLALRYIHAYFVSLERLNSVFMMQRDSPVPPNGPRAFFAISEASRACLDHAAVDLFDEDIDDIMGDIEVARVALRAFGATQFVLDLLSWPGVEKAIDEAGGWAPVEGLARIMQVHHLMHDCPDSSHLELLVDFSALRRRLRTQLEQIKLTSAVAQVFLQDLWTRFKRAGSRKRPRYTNEAIIKQALLDASSTPQFPKLTDAVI